MRISGSCLTPMILDAELGKHSTNKSSIGATRCRGSNSVAANPVGCHYTSAGALQRHSVGETSGPQECHEARRPHRSARLHVAPAHDVWGRLAWLAPGGRLSTVTPPVGWHEAGSPIGLRRTTDRIAACSSRSEKPSAGRCLGTIDPVCLCGTPGHSRGVPDAARPMPPSFDCPAEPGGSRPGWSSHAVSASALCMPVTCDSGDDFSDGPLTASPNQSGRWPPNKRCTAGLRHLRRCVRVQNWCQNWCQNWFQCDI